MSGCAQHSYPCPKLNGYLHPNTYSDRDQGYQAAVLFLTYANEGSRGREAETDQGPSANLASTDGTAAYSPAYTAHRTTSDGTAASDSNFAAG